MPHELARALGDVELPLCQTLCDMLEESPQHRTERRGSGFTQATRFLADRINHPRDPHSPEDFAIFNHWPRRSTLGIAARCSDLGWHHGWRQLDKAPQTILDAIEGLPGADELLTLPHQLQRARKQLQREESLLLLDMIADILSCRESPVDELPPMPEKPEIGSCSQAEEFFLEISHGKIRRGGRVNIFVDDAGKPLLVEKIALGESHSAIFVRQAGLNGVAIPAGGLAALRHHAESQPIATYLHGDIYPLSALAEARFLRLTTLAIAPAYRERAFGDQFRRQVQGNMLSPRSTTIKDLERFALQGIPV